MQASEALHTIKRMITERAALDRGAELLEALVQAEGETARLETLNVEFVKLNTDLKADNERLETAKAELEAMIAQKGVDFEKELSDRREQELAKIEGEKKAVLGELEAERLRRKQHIDSLDRQIGQRETEAKAAEDKLVELRALLREARDRSNRLLVD